MTFTRQATVDGNTLRLDQPVALPANSRVRVTIEADDGSVGEPEKPVSFFEVARSLKLRGRPDWSENLDRYLHGDGTEPRPRGYLEPPEDPAEPDRS